MNPLLWFALWLTLPPSALLSNPDNCIINESRSPKHDSLLMESLNCYNDYETHVQCWWREHEGKDLQLWIKTEDENGPCEPYSAAEQNTSEQGITQCRYKTRTFSIGTEHIVSFRDKQNLCSSIRPLDLSQLLRARTPVDLFTHDAGDGGWQIGWSSPYPSSFSLNKNITYQLSYRMDTQDIWTTLNATSTRVKLEKQQLILGHRYKARVRARASVGQWSHWSPVVTWKTENDAGYVPSLHCVLDGEEEVTCSWEVSREVALSISYHLVCRRNQTAPSERCCVSPTVTTNHSRDMLKFSCSLNIADPEHLQLDLQPTRNSKIFKANEHIHPNPPSQVELREEGSSWMVNWTKPRAPPELRLNYQVCYYRIEEQGCAAPLNVSGASTTLIIPDSFLVPSQRYKVQVRSLVDPGGDFMYGGTPSKWTHPVEWTSHKATWSLHTLIYCSIGVFVAIVSLTLYCTIPACQRKVVLWVESVPSPGKSKILSEIKSVTHWTLKQSENTSFCKVQHSDSISTRYSVASLWLAKDDEGIVLEPDEGCDTGDDLPVPAEEVVGSGTSSLSFSGPYIFCQSSESKKIPEVEMCEEEEQEEQEEEKETSSNDSVSPSPLNFTIFGEGYVSLPARSVSQSTQDLVSHRSMITNTNRLGSSTELDLHCPESSPWPDQTCVQQCLSEPSNSLQPTAHTSVTFTSWPQGGTIQASGYCHIPTAHI